MSSFGKCPKHDIEYDADEADCSMCSGEGVVEDDDFGFIDWVTCWSCKGSGECSYPVCYKCDEEYEDD